MCLRAVDRAGEYGLKVIAKNPLLMEGDPTPYLAHPDVFGAIVERGAGDPVRMDRLRKAAGKPDLPIWFVAFGAGRAWADDVSNKARGLKNIGVTVSAHGEYRTSTDILRPPEASKKTKRLAAARRLLYLENRYGCIVL